MDPFPSLEIAKCMSVSHPHLKFCVVHGVDDTVVPVACGEAMAAALRCPFKAVPKADHVRIMNCALEEAKDFLWE